MSRPWTPSRKAVREAVSIIWLDWIHQEHPNQEAAGLSIRGWEQE